jgi:hypothetical protein
LTQINADATEAIKDNRVLGHARIWRGFDAAQPWGAASERSLLR